MQPARPGVWGGVQGAFALLCGATYAKCMGWCLSFSFAALAAGCWTSIAAASCDLCLYGGTVLQDCLLCVVSSVMCRLLIGDVHAAASAAGGTHQLAGRHAVLSGRLAAHAHHSDWQVDPSTGA